MFVFWRAVKWTVDDKVFLLSPSSFMRICCSLYTGGIYFLVIWFRGEYAVQSSTASSVFPISIEARESKVVDTSKVGKTLEFFHVFFLESCFDGKERNEKSACIYYSGVSISVKYFVCESLTKPTTTNKAVSFIVFTAFHSHELNLFLTYRQKM